MSPTDPPLPPSDDDPIGEPSWSSGGNAPDGTRGAAPDGIGDGVEGEPGAADPTTAAALATEPEVESPTAAHRRRVSRRRYLIRRGIAAVFVLAVAGGIVALLIWLSARDDGGEAENSVPGASDEIVTTSSKPTSTTSSGATPTSSTLSTLSTLSTSSTMSTVSNTPTTRPARTTVPVVGGVADETTDVPGSGGGETTDGQLTGTIGAGDSAAPLDTTESDSTPGLSGASETSENSGISEPSDPSESSATSTGTSGPEDSGPGSSLSTSSTDDDGSPASTDDEGSTVSTGDDGSSPPDSSEPGSTLPEPPEYDLDVEATCQMTVGAAVSHAGRNVECLELRLAQVIVGPVPFDVDSLFGEDTEIAVRQFQQANDLLVDGIVGPETARLLGIWPN